MIGFRSMGGTVQISTSADNANNQADRPIFNKYSEIKRFVNEHHFA